MAEFTGRILPLLWRHKLPARKAAGRPPRLTVDVVVGAGIRIADTEGLEAASMARVAAELKVGTMTLYTYVPSRDDLIDLMVDQVFVQRGLASTNPIGFRRQIGIYAEKTFEMYRSHPWLAQVSHQRPPIGPGMLAEVEYVISAVAQLNLPTEQINTAATTISAWIVSAARREAESTLLSRETGLSSDEWWLQRGELWEKWFDVEEHPAMTALWNAGGISRGAEEQARDSYEYGLALLLDGIERSVQ